MKKETKDGLNDIAVKMLKDYNAEVDPIKKGAKLSELIKTVNTIKEIETQDIDNKLKKSKFKLDLDQYNLDIEKLDIEKTKIADERIQKEKSNSQEINKLNLEDSKLKFEQTKFESDTINVTKDRVINGIMKGLEIGLPVLIYGGLSVLSLKAIYKDDARIPSDTWSFIRSVSKR